MRFEIMALDDIKYSNARFVYINKHFVNIKNKSE